MKRTIALLLAMLVAGCSPALAIVQGCSATPNQELHFRTGPNTAFGDLYVLPRSTEVTAIELEEGNDVVWVLCDFAYEGNRVRAYTGLKRLDLDGPVAWASNYDLPRTLVNDADVYSAPDGTSRVRDTLRAGSEVTFLNFEGSYCFIEYQKGKWRQRGYVHESAFWIDQYEFAEWFPDNEDTSWYVVRTPAYVYETCDDGGQPLFSIPYDRSVTLDSGADLSDGWIRVYYAGKWVYGHRGDFNDLRGYVEPGW